MPQSNLEKFYSDRIHKFQERADKLSQEDTTYSFIRLAIFVVLSAVVVWLANERAGEMIAIVSASGLVLFMMVVKKHNKVRFDLLKAQNIAELNKEEVSRQKGELHDLPSGIENIDINHPYVPDLDIFGFNSLFQLLVRSRLSGTRQLLSEWLKTPASKEQILTRQSAISEIRQDIDWQQEITALGMQKKSSQEGGIEPIIEWLKEKPAILTGSIWKVLQWVLPAISTTFIIGWWLMDWPYHWLYASLFVHVIILGKLFNSLKETSKNMNGMGLVMESYERIIVTIESKQYDSPLLSELRQKFQTHGVQASAAIKKLRSILFAFESRWNMLYGPIDLLFCTDLMIHQQANQWKEEFGIHFEEWIETVHQFDALSNLASYAHANPEHVFPSVSDKNFVLNSKNLGHPLIKKTQRVSNDFEINGAGSLALITGSNMSGKSTFLRTVGVNLVLAQMGAPVCASEFTSSLTRIFTSMRTQDNLEENVSSFYAELKRIKQLLDATGEDTPIFYMLDEILKGTNSDDRHHGAVHLIQQLTEKQCTGFISTHDLQLSELAKDIKNISNYSFNNTIQEDEIVFDYKLTPGPCKSFNASKLMEKMGIIKKGS